jgi:hypothetical protein
MRSGMKRGVRMGASLVAVAVASVHAQPDAGPGEGAARRGFSITPTLSVTETLTDNALLSSSDRRADLVSQVSPGIRMSSTGGRFRGFLDYSLTGIVYANNSHGNDLQNALNGAFNVEAIEKWAFVDVSANISQQLISAYGRALPTRRSSTAIAPRYEASACRRMCREGWQASPTTKRA